MKTEQGTVLVVDDDADVRHGLELLMHAAGLATRCFASGEELLASGPPAGPACLLLDFRMPGASGIEVQERLDARGWDVPIIFLTGHADVPVAVQALKRGALDFFEKGEFNQRELLERVRGALRLHSARIEERRSSEAFRRRIENLSERELEVARLAASGMANKVIGLELGISERTVEVHRGRAMRKLELKSAAELVRLEPLLAGSGN